MRCVAMRCVALRCGIRLSLSLSPLVADAIVRARRVVVVVFIAIADIVVAIVVAIASPSLARALIIGHRPSVDVVPRLFFPRRVAMGDSYCVCEKANGWVIVASCPRARYPLRYGVGLFNLRGKALRARPRGSLIRSFLLPREY